MATKQKGDKKASTTKTDKQKMKVLKGKKGKPEENGSEDLSEFQGTEKTGRGRKSTDQLHDEMKEKKQKKAGTTIEKVKLSKKGLDVTISVIETDGSTTKDSKALTRPVHQNLKNALAAVAIHWAILVDYLSTRAVPDIKKYDPALVEGIKVSGISIGGNDGEEGIMITAQKTSRRKKVIIVNSPFERFEEVADSRYKYMDNLEELVKNIMIRTEKYLSGEEVGEDAQPEINFPAEELVDEPAE